MTIADLLSQIPTGYKECFALVVVLSLIEVSPIKLNPWKWLKGFAELPTRLTTLEDAFEKDRAYRWRTEILRFADATRKGSESSKESWDDIKDCIRRYDEYCDGHREFKNGKTVAAAEYLNKKYELLMETNGFLE